jgi:purine-binding chemotaxis protein CheW
MNKPVLPTGKNETIPQDPMVLLTFEVAHQVYGLPVTDVVRIIEMVTITPLANLPRALQGVINVRGKIVSVLDLRRRFGLPEQPYHLHTPIILVDLQRQQMMGLVVDRVLDVVHLTGAELETTEAIVPANLVLEVGEQMGYLAGIAKVNRQIIPMLKVQGLLTPTEQVEVVQALNGQSQLIPIS